MPIKRAPPNRKTADPARSRTNAEGPQGAARERIFNALAGRAVEEKRMMGALVFMVDGHMCCGLTGGALMVRIGAARRDAALMQPHVSPMDIGGRSPRGFILVAPEGFAADADLHCWLAAALAFVATLPARREARAASGR